MKEIEIAERQKVSILKKKELFKNWVVSVRSSVRWK